MERRDDAGRPTGTGSDGGGTGGRSGPAHDGPERAGAGALTPSGDGVRHDGSPPEGPAAVADAVHSTLFRTTSADETRAYLAEAYGTTVRLGSAARSGAVFRHERRTSGALCLDEGRLAASVVYEVQPLDDLLVLDVLGGRMRLDCGRSGAYAAGGVLLAAAPGTPMRTAVEHMHARAAVLHPDLLRDVAGLPREAPIPPGLHTAAAPAETARWRACARYAWSLLDDGPAAAGPGTTLVRDAAARLLAAVALEAFPGFRTRSDPLAPGAGRVGPAALRRAAEFAHDHADGPVGPSDMAAAAGVPPRVLHAAFADALGTTPRTYLRRVRLMRARADLAAADPAAGVPAAVAAVAARWGWGRPGLFSDAYAALHGEPPGETLRRSRPSE
ncbi:helix-turn-helix domain-containing protein [Streptomyces globosus]